MNDDTSSSTVFHQLCNCDTIPANGAKGFNVAGIDLFAVNKGKDYYVYLNRCPHLRLPLNWIPDQFLDGDGELIQCSSHGALFVVENGRCVAGPCSGQHLQRVETKIEAGSLFVAIPVTTAG